MNSLQLRTYECRHLGVVKENEETYFLHTCICSYTLECTYLHTAIRSATIPAGFEPWILRLCMCLFP
jgi:hypothetical protein